MPFMREVHDRVRRTRVGWLSRVDATWEVQLAEARPRTAVDPDGREITITDTDPGVKGDTASPGIRGDSFDTLVSTTGATQLDVDTSGGNTAGQPLTIRVRARDNNGNVDTTYRGTIHFTSTDPAATLPADYTFTAADNGRHDFPAVAFATAGAQTVDAADVADAGRRGSDPVYVYSATATYLEVQVFSSDITAGHPATMRIRARNANGDIDTLEGCTTFQPDAIGGSSDVADVSWNVPTCAKR